MTYRFDLTTTDEPLFLAFGDDDAANAYADILDNEELYAGHTRHTPNR